MDCAKIDKFFEKIRNFNFCSWLHMHISSQTQQNHIFIKKTPHFFKLLASLISMTREKSEIGNKSAQSLEIDN